MNHGTYTAYARKGCRCESCCAYQNGRVARNRAERLAKGRLNHGKRSAYDAGCRCDQCKQTRANENETGMIGRHNHMTRDIKMFGQCEACDDYWAGTGR